MSPGQKPAGSPLNVFRMLILLKSREASNPSRVAGPWERVLFHRHPQVKQGTSVGVKLGAGSERRVVV